MKTKTLLPFLALALMAAAAAPRLAAQGYAFPYQGVLNVNGAPANNLFDLRFALYDSLAGGTRIGSQFNVPATPVTNGLFQATLDFEANAFPGAARFLEIQVRANGTGDSFTTLSPRQAILPTPYAITAGTVPGGAITGAQLASGAVTAAKLATNAVGTAQLADGSVTPAKLSTTNLVLSRLSAPDGTPANAVQVDNSGNVGIGTLSPATRLDVRGDITLEVGRNPFIYTGTGIPLVQRYVELLDSPSVNDASGLKAGGVLVADNYSYASPGRNDLIVKGNVGIGTATPQANLDVTGAIYCSYDGNEGGSLTLHNPRKTGNAADRWTLYNMTGGYGNSFQIYNYPVSGAPGCCIKRFVVYDDGTTVLAPSGGNVGIGTSTPQAKLDVIGTIRTSVLTITGGSDLSERFDIAAPGGALEPGMVVCIDPANPGKLVRSSKAFDRTVAGIISGANGVETGLTMGQAGTAADGKYPVALTGRVYVHADASAAPIQPGDLLTTSATPGHCQAVTDAAKATGAVIGKAMTALPEGKGLVLVLVSLQ